MIEITAVDIYQALAVKRGLEFYAAHHMPINTRYTPNNMIHIAEKITGKRFKPRDYLGAAKGLNDWCEKNTKG